MHSSERSRGRFRLEITTTSLQYDRLLCNYQHGTWYLLHRHTFFPGSINTSPPPVSELGGIQGQVKGSGSKLFSAGLRLHLSSSEDRPPLNILLTYLISPLDGGVGLSEGEREYSIPLADLHVP